SRSPEQGPGQSRRELQEECGVDGSQEMKAALLVLAAVTLAGCQSMPSDAPRATAELQPTKGNKTAGTVDFYQVGEKVRVVANVSGLTPGREHGFHVHDAGDCSSVDGTSANGHFNPQGKPQGDPILSERHAGDMRMLRADASGNARPDTQLDVMTV